MRKTFMLILSLIISSHTLGVQAQGTVKTKRGNMELKDTVNLDFKSSAFKDGEFIPVKYTCDSKDISPALNWSKPPDSAKSLVLICEDPDAPAGTWIHWVLYNIQPSVTALAENIAKNEIVDSMAQGRNSFGKIGYGGPCPPPGKPHRYYFRLYAIDLPPTFKPGLNRDEIMKAIEGHFVGRGELMGRYGR
jgi:Raf kinase inhibitor-like YbhB/YbcL family protein